MRQRRRLNESRNIGLSAIVSLRALNVATFISFRGFFHQPGTNPHRIGTSVRSPPPETTTSIVSVGQMLYRGWRFDGAAIVRWYNSTNSRHPYILVNRPHMEHR